MCFTPTISLATAIIEFILATILLLFFKKTDLRNFFVVIIYLLGFYQFTEFMLCNSNSPFLWAKIGFSTYSFLPAITLHAVLKFLKKKPSLILIYTIPMFALITAFATPEFIMNTQCNNFFITVNTIFNDTSLLSNGILFWTYTIYYFGFVLFGIILLYKNYQKQKSKIKKEIEIVEIAGILLATIPTIILIIFLPFSRFELPSILCQFALLVAIAAFIGVYLEDEGKKRQKKK